MYWMEFFNLNEDCTLKDLKRAYAKLLKKVHPEDDPEYFMEIRNQYEVGREYFENKDVPQRTFNYKGNTIFREPTFEYNENIETQGRETVDYEYEDIEDENTDGNYELEEMQRADYDGENTIEKNLDNSEELQTKTKIEYDDKNTIDKDLDDVEELEANDSLECDNQNTINRDVDSGEEFQIKNDLDYSEENTIDQTLDEREFSKEEELLKNNIEISAQHQSYVDDEDIEINDYEVLKKLLSKIYNDTEKRFDINVWVEFFSNLNLVQDEIFREIFESYFENNLAFSSEVAELILRSVSDFSKGCIERLELIKKAEFNYSGYDEFSYEEREDFFRIRYLIYAWFKGAYQSIDIKSSELKSIRNLAIKLDVDFRLILNYMLQNFMYDGINYYLEIYDEEKLIENGYMAYRAQSYYETEQYSKAYDSYKAQFKKFNKDEAFRIGTYSAGRKLVQLGKKLYLPRVKSKSVFGIWKKSPRYIKKMNKLGCERVLLRRILKFVMNMLIIAIMAIGISKFITIPTEELSPIAAMISNTIQGLIGLGVLFIGFRICFSRKREK
ncbi:MAG: hypothetical protein N4A40_10055 [Tissierellales bacterium]|nr:hypothetical protein [Tissierellales bacterium]